MAKKKEPTIAERAQAIVNKYKRRLGDNFENHDALAEASMNRELEALQEEQESKRQAIAEQEQSMQMAYGGKLRQMWDGGTYDATYTRPYSSKEYNKRYSGLSDPFLALKNYKPEVAYNGWTNELPPDQSISLDTALAPAKNFTYNEPVNRPSDEKLGLWKSMDDETKAGIIAQLAGTVGSGIGALVAQKKPNEVETPMTTTAPYEKAYFGEERRALRDATVDMMRSARAYSPTMYGEMAAQANQAYQRGLGALASEEAKINTQGLNDYNLRTSALQQEDLKRKADLATHYNDLMYDYDNSRAGIISEMIGGLGTSVAGGLKDYKSYQLEDDKMKYLSQNGWTRIKLPSGASAIASTPAPGLASFQDPTSSNMIYMVDGQYVSSTDYMKALKERKVFNPTPQTVGNIN